MIPKLTRNYKAGAAVAAMVICKLSADDTVIHAAAAADLAIGISTGVAADSGGDCDVIHQGIAEVLVGAAGVTRGMGVTSDASGFAINATDGERAVGVALASGVSGDIIPVLVLPLNYAGASVAGVDANAVHINPAGDQTIANGHALINTGGFTGPLVGNADTATLAKGAQDTVTAAAGDGAIAVKSGTVKVTKAGVAALTLADPATPADDGKRLTIVSTTANAHTVSNAAGSGFNAGGAGSDVATFGGAIGDGMEVVAIGGKWIALRLTNVTLG